MRKLFARAAVAAFAASAFIAPIASATSPPSSSNLGYHLSQTRPTAPNWRSDSGDEYDSYDECTLDAFTDPDVGGLSGVDCYQLDNGEWTY